MNQYLKTGIQQLLQNRSFINNLSTWSMRSAEQIKKDFQYGSGPKINPMELKNAYGSFSASNPEYINISSDFLDKLEKSSIVMDKEAMLFLLGIIIGHEYAHYGNNKENVDMGSINDEKIEEGNKFEVSTFGRIADESNVKGLLKNWKSNFATMEKQSSNEKKSSDMNQIIESGATGTYRYNEELRKWERQ